MRKSSKQTKSSTNKHEVLRSLSTAIRERRTDLALQILKKYYHTLPSDIQIDHLYASLLLQVGDYRASEQIFDKIIALESAPSQMLNNAAIVKKRLGKNSEALSLLEKIIEKDPLVSDYYNNLGNLLFEIGEYQEADRVLRSGLSVQPNNVAILYNLGNVHRLALNPGRARSFYEQAINIEPSHISARLNLASLLADDGQYIESNQHAQAVLSSQNDNSSALNMLGNNSMARGDVTLAKSYYLSALAKNPTSFVAQWNLQSTAIELTDAISIVKGATLIRPDSTEAQLMYEGLLLATNNAAPPSSYFDASEHPMARSIRWIESTKGKSTKIFFNRWQLFSYCVSLIPDIQETVFYEFGVWRGDAFRFLMDYFSRGVGFDTFTGIPEQWHHEAVGTYSSDSVIPDIPNAEFVVGRFEDTLEAYFSQPRPTAGIINFDADLYSSTIQALTHCRKTISANTILIFDEYLVNEHWELDEHKALIEFCDTHDYEFEIVAFSYYTKQVAVRLR